MTDCELLIMMRQDFLKIKEELLKLNNELKQLRPIVLIFLNKSDIS